MSKSYSTTKYSTCDSTVWSVGTESNTVYASPIITCTVDKTSGTPDAKPSAVVQLNTTDMYPQDVDHYIHCVPTDYCIPEYTQYLGAWVTQEAFVCTGLWYMACTSTTESMTITIDDNIEPVASTGGSKLTLEKCNLAATSDSYNALCLKGTAGNGNWSSYYDVLNCSINNLYYMNNDTDTSYTTPITLNMSDFNFSTYRCLIDGSNMCHQFNHGVLVIRCTTANYANAGSSDSYVRHQFFALPYNVEVSPTFIAKMRYNTSWTSDYTVSGSTPEWPVGYYDADDKWTSQDRDVTITGTLFIVSSSSSTYTSARAEKLIFEDTSTRQATVSNLTRSNSARTFYTGGSSFTAPNPLRCASRTYTYRGSTFTYYTRDYSFPRSITETIVSDTGSALNTTADVSYHSHSQSTVGTVSSVSHTYAVNSAASVTATATSWPVTTTYSYSGEYVTTESTFISYNTYNDTTYATTFRTSQHSGSAPIIDVTPNPSLGLLHAGSNTANTVTINHMYLSNQIDIKLGNLSIQTPFLYGPLYNFLGWQGCFQDYSVRHYDIPFEKYGLHQTYQGEDVYYDTEDVGTYQSMTGNLPQNCMGKNSSTVGCGTYFLFSTPDLSGVPDFYYDETTGLYYSANTASPYAGPLDRTIGQMHQHTKFTMGCMNQGVHWPAWIDYQNSCFNSTTYRTMHGLNNYSASNSNLNTIPHSAFYCMKTSTWDATTCPSSGGYGMFIKPLDCVHRSTGYSNQTQVETPAATYSNASKVLCQVRQPAWCWSNRTIFSFSLYGQPASSSSQQSDAWKTPTYWSGAYNQNFSAAHKQHYCLGPLDPDTAPEDYDDIRWQAPAPYWYDGISVRAEGRGGYFGAQPVSSTYNSDGEFIVFTPSVKTAFSYFARGLHTLLGQYLLINGPSYLWPSACDTFTQSTYLRFGRGSRYNDTHYSSTGCIGWNNYTTSTRTHAIEGNTSGTELHSVTISVYNKDNFVFADDLATLIGVHNTSYIDPDITLKNPYINYVNYSKSLLTIFPAYKLRNSISMNPTS